MFPIQGRGPFWAIFLQMTLMLASVVCNSTHGYPVDIPCAFEVFVLNGIIIFISILFGYRYALTAFLCRSLWSGLYCKHHIMKDRRR